MDNVRTRIDHVVPGLQIETAQLMEDLIGDLTSVPQPIEIKLYSDDEKTLETVSAKVKQAIEKVNGVVEVNSGIVAAGDSLNIEVDRVKAALEGMDPDSITTMLDGYPEQSLVKCAFVTSLGRFNRSAPLPAQVIVNSPL